MDLRTCRFLKGLSQMELMRRSGVLQCRISAIENGHVKPRNDEREQLEKALGLKKAIDWSGDKERRSFVYIS